MANQRFQMQGLLACCLIIMSLAGCAKDKTSDADKEKQAFDDLRAEVRLVVSDADRQSQAIKLVDELQVDLSEFRDDLNQRRARFQELNANYDTTREELEAFLSSVDAHLVANRSKVADSHLALFSALTPEERAELNKVHTKAMKSFSKLLRAYQGGA